MYFLMLFRTSYSSFAMVAVSAAGEACLASCNQTAPLHSNLRLGSADGEGGGAIGGVGGGTVGWWAEDVSLEPLSPRTDVYAVS